MLDLLCNDITNCLTGISLINADFGPEGTPLYTHDNRFYMPSTSTRRVWGTTSSFIQRFWYYRNPTSDPAGLDVNPSSNIDVEPFDRFIPEYTIFPGTSTSACGYLLTADYEPGSNAWRLASSSFTSANARDSIFSFVVDSLLPDTLEDISGVDYWKILNAYQIFNQDNSWLYRGHSNDSIYISYYNEVKNSSIGDFVRCWNNLLTEPTDSTTFATLSLSLGSDNLAMSYLDSLQKIKIYSAISDIERITPAHPFDTHLKAVMGLYGSYWAQGKYILSSTDSSILESYVNGDVFTIGPAGNIARMMLNVVVFEDSTQARIGQFTDNSITSPPLHFQVFPNPNNGTFTVNIDKSYLETPMYFEI